MGGCYKERNAEQITYSNLIDNGEGLGNFELNKNYDSKYYAKIALKRVLKHKENLIKANPYDKEFFDESLRSALTYMIKGELRVPETIGSKSLRYLKNRISVPRDMPVISARLFRQSLNKIESLCKNKEEDRIPIKHRYDQDPSKFLLN